MLYQRVNRQNMIALLSPSYRSLTFKMIQFKTTLACNVQFLIHIHEIELIHFISYIGSTSNTNSRTANDRNQEIQPEPFSGLT